MSLTELLTNYQATFTATNGNHFALISKKTFLRYTKEAWISFNHNNPFLMIDQLLVVERKITHHESLRVEVFNRDLSPSKLCLNGAYSLSQIEKNTKNSTHILMAETLFQTTPQEPKKMQFSLATLKPTIKKTTSLNNINNFKFALDPTEVNIQNPHLLLHWQSDWIDDQTAKTIGSQLQHSYRKSSGINVSFFQKSEGNSLKLRTFERGVGLTDSCGSACLALSLLIWEKQKNNTPKSLSIHQKGGITTIDIQKNHILFQAQHIQHHTNWTVTIPS